MTKCCIRGCNSNSRKNAEGLSFFRFPKNEDLKKTWMDNIGAENIKSSAVLRICSKHFDTNCVNRTLDVVRLKEDVVPTLFPFTPSSVTQIALSMKPENVDDMALIKPTASRLLLVGPCIEENVPPCKPLPMDGNIIQPNYKLLQPTNIDVNSSHNTKQKSSMVVSVTAKTLPKINVEKLYRQVKLQQKKIKILNQKCRRLQQKLVTSQSIIDELKKQNSSVKQPVPHEGAILLKECAGSSEFQTRPYVVKIMGTLHKCSQKQKHV